MKVSQAIQFTLQCLIAIYIALEISIPPNPYKTHLIILLTIYICLKYDVPSKIINTIVNYRVKLIKRLK